MEELNVTRTLASFAAKVTYESLPREVTEFIKLCIIDQFGVQLCLSTRPVSRIAFSYATRYGHGSSSIMASSATAPPEFAAFANGVYGHAFELDDMHLPSLNHPGPIVVPSALAMGQEAESTGPQFLAAVAAGYEVMGRIGRGMGRDYVYGRGYHPVGVIGPIGSVVAASKIMGLPADKLFHAIGLATSHGGGTIEYNQTWGETTRLHAGLAAMGGIRSAVLAKAGLRAPGAPIGGKYGFARVHSDQCDFASMVSELGSKFTLLYTNFKLRPYHGILHAVVDKALEAISSLNLQKDLDLSTAINSVKVGLNSAAMRGLVEGEDESRERHASSTHLQFSLRVPLANAIIHGGNIDSVLDYKPDDPRVTRLAAKISAALDKECEAEWYRDQSFEGPRVLVRVQIAFADGRAAEGFGNPFQVPRSPEQIYGKFRNLSGRVIPRAQAEELLEVLTNLDLLENINRVRPLLVPQY